MSEVPQLLLDHHLKTLRLPTFLREYSNGGLSDILCARPVVVIG
jgi:hypothetical protein